jgi:hypothetical protein
MLNCHYAIVLQNPLCLIVSDLKRLLRAAHELTSRTIAVRPPYKAPKHTGSVSDKILQNANDFFAFSEKTLELRVEMMLKEFTLLAVSMVRASQNLSL